jgi:hypothetical protein
MDLAIVDREVYKQGKSYLETVPWVQQLDLSHLDNLFTHINCRLHATCDFREIIGCLAILEQLASKYPARTFGIRDKCHIQEEMNVYGYGNIPNNIMFIIGDKYSYYNGKKETVDWKELKVGYGVFMLESAHPNYIHVKKNKFKRSKHVFKMIKEETQKAAIVRNNNHFSALEIEECFED